SARQGLGTYPRSRGCSPKATYRPLHPATTPPHSTAISNQPCSQADSRIYCVAMAEQLLEQVRDIVDGQIVGVPPRTVARTAADLKTQIQDFEGQKLAELIANVALSVSGVRLLVQYADFMLTNRRRSSRSLLVSTYRTSSSPCGLSSAAPLSH